MADRVALLKLEIQGIKEVDELKDKLKSLKKGTDDYNSTLKQLNTTESQLSKTRSNLLKSTKDLIGDSKKGLTGVSDASGAATASALELGRVISDAPYGIRGMANNVSQLASQFSFMSNKVDESTGKVVGFNGALKNFGKAIKANAVLLLIQAVISAFDYFAGSVSKAEKELNSFSDTVSEGFAKISKIESLNKVIESSNSTIEQQTEALERLKKLGFDGANQGIEEFIENQKKLVIVNAGIKAVETQLKDIYTERLELFSKFKEEYATLLDIQKNGYGGEDISKAVLQQLKLDKEELDKKEEELKSELTRLVRNSLDLDVTTGGKDKKRNTAKILEEIAGIDTSDESQQDYKDKLTEFFDFSDIDFNKQFEERLKLLDLSKQLGLITSEQYEQYRKDLDKEFSQHHVVTGIAPELDFTLSEGTRKGIEEFNKSVTDEIIRQSRLEEYDEYAKQLQKVLGSINDFLNSEFERQLTMEQNKTNALNNELHQRLLNEKLSKDERKAIQNEIAQNDEKLRIKQQAIEKKKFKQQKAFNIAMATIDTFRAATGVLADTKGGSFARIAGMVAVISSGLLQVAAISRQKFQSSSASSPVRGGASGAGGDGVGDRSFNFNLVGNTLGNQITDAIQGQFDQPLKAYVVSRDITSQQALDANIKGTASF